MMKYTPLNYEGFEKYLEIEEKAFDGLHCLFMFDNDYDVSVVKHAFSYGHEKDLFELMIIAPDDHDLEPIGFLTNKEVLEKLEEVKGKKIMEEMDEVKKEIMIKAFNTFFEIKEDIADDEKIIKATEKELYALAREELEKTLKDLVDGGAFGEETAIAFRLLFQNIVMKMFDRLQKKDKEDEE